MSNEFGYSHIGYTASPWGSDYHSRPEHEVLGAGSAGPGKALAVDTPIPTARGFVAMGDLVVGDVLFDETGAKCVVEWCSPVMYGHPCRRVVFDDGTSIVADSEHLWLTMDYRERQSLLHQEKRTVRTGLNDQRCRALRPQIRTTEDIASSLMHKGRKNHAVMNAAPVQPDEAWLRLHPYVLGVWLGDGTTREGSITTADQEVLDELARLGWKARKQPSQKYTYGVPGLAKPLRKLGVLGNKRIPSEYMFASEKQREALLRGLVDTDGSVDRDGRVELTFCRKVLAEDAHTLVCSLGLKATISEGPAMLRGVEVGRRWRICFSPMGRRLATIRRKAERLGIAGARTQRWRYIVSADPCQSVPVRCIRVSSRSRLFLAGKQFVPTHNTWVLLMDPLPLVKLEHDRCFLPKTHPLYHPKGTSVGWALHLRRTVKMLEQSIQRTHRIFPLIDPDVRWDVQKTTWTFSSGFKFQFGHCKDLDSWEDYMSCEYVHLAFDELVQFTQEQYDQIRTRVRCADPLLSKSLRVRSMSNPMMKFASAESVAMKGDPHWVRKRFVDPWPQGNRTLKEKFRRMDGSEGFRTRRYVPAKITDNPDKAFVAQYEETLASAKPHIRQALLYGNWYVTAGSFFADEWNDRLHVRKPFAIPSTWKLFRSMDWGYKSPGAILWWAIDEDGNMWGVREVTFKEKSVAEVCDIVKQVEIGLGTWRRNRSVLTGPADTQLWEKRGEMGESKAETFSSRGINWVPADKRSRQSNAERLTFRLKDHDNGTKTPGIVFFDCCKKSIATIPAIQTDPDNSELPADGGDDHWLDTCLYATAYASREGVGEYIPDDGDELDEDDDEPAGESRGRFGYGSF